MELRLLALACLVGAALAGPFQRDAGSRCTEECAPTSEKFSYQIGRKYVYNYKSSNDMSLAGGRKQLKSEISGKAEIHVKEQCEMALQLRDVRIENLSDENLPSLIEKLESYPLQFSWSDGNITNVCSSPSETHVSLNIKRAILSALINTMSDFQSFSTYKETDGLGTCDTEYTSRGEYQGSIKIRKEKQLKSCDNRHSSISAIIANPYEDWNSGIRSLPIFTDEKLECEQEIQDGVVQKVVCTERATVKPLQKFDSIAEMKGVISLSLETVSGSRGVQRLSEMERKPILYSYAQEEQIEEKEREVDEILRQLCTESRSIIHPSVSKLYYNLIKAVRSLSRESIERIYGDLKSGRLCDSSKTLDIFLDALPMAGTEGAIKLMVRLIKEKEITGLKAKVWPASLALIPNPSAEAVAAVTPLLSGEERSRPVLLGVSAMIYRICSSRDCDRVQSVRRVVNHLHRSLGERCSSDDDDEVITVLKAFGNMGYIGEAEDSVVQCATSPDKPIEVRLAAIDAFRRIQGKRPSQIVGLYSNPAEDFEVRIAALVGAFKYPDPALVRIIENVMETERDVQVTAFTRSFLKNLNGTSSPLKQEHKKLSRNIKIRQHDVGYWENSKNIELSAFNSPLNIGGSMESNIVHSPGSKLPRSGSARIDIDLFGKNINLVEFGLRAEGVETAFKKLLGMNEQSLKKSKKSWLTRTLQKATSESAPVKTKASIYLRTMDTEIFDYSASDLTSVGNMMQFADVLNKLAQGQKSDFAHSFMFIDTKIVVPSVSGRSYALSLVGTTNVGLSANGKFDAVNLMSTPRNCDISGRFQPSANVELAATVGIQSEKSRPDVKIVTSFHAESDVEAKLRVKDGHLLEARWNLPSEKIQLVKLSTDVYEIGSDNVERPLFEEMQTKVDHCTKSLVKPLGIQICGKLQIPHPFVSRSFPFARGFGNIELSLKKSEPSMEGYEMYIEIPKHKSDFMVYKASIDTPGSSVQRRFSAKLEMKRSSSGEREFQFDAESPFKSISSSGTYERQPSHIKGDIQVVTDKSRRYSMKAFIETTSSGSEKTYKPSIQWTSPHSDPVTLSGSVKHVQGRKQQLMIDLKSNKPSGKPFLLTGNLMKDGQLSLLKDAEWRLSSDLVAKSPWISMKIRSAADKQSHESRSLSASLSVDYQKGKSRRQAIRFSSKSQQKDSGKLSSSAQFESTQKPSCNWLLSWDMQGTLKEAMKNDVVLRYGENPEHSYFHLTQLSKHGGQTALSEAKLSLKAPQFGVDSELKVAADLDFKRNSNFHVETDLRYTGEKHMKSLMKVQRISSKPLKMVLRAQLEIPSRKMSYTDEIVESSPNEYQGNSRFQWNEDKQASLSYKYRKLSSRSTMHHEMESTLQAPSLSAPVQHKASIKLTPESFHLENRMKMGTKPSYFVTAAIQRHSGPSELALRLPRVEGSLKMQNDEHLKSATLDVKCTRSSRHVVATGQIRLGNKKALEGEIRFDADRNPRSKVSFSSEVEISNERSRKSYNIATQFQYLDTINLKVESNGKSSIGGPHHLMIDVSGRSFESRNLNLHHEANPSEIHSTFSYQKSHVEKAKVELQGKILKRSSGAEVSGGISLKSSDGSLEERELAFKHFHSKSHSSFSSKCEMRLQSSSNKVYACEVEISHQARQSTDVKVHLSTPHKRFQMQKFQMSLRRSHSRQSLEVTAEYGSSKKATLTSILDKTRAGRKYSMTVTTPSSLVREAKYFVAYENQRSMKQVESHFELNRELMYDAAVSFEKQSRNLEIRSHLKTAATPELAATFKSESGEESYKHEVLLTKNLRKVFSCKISKQSSRKDFTYSFDVQDSQKSLVDIKLAKEHSDSSTKYTAKAKGSFTPLSVMIQTTRNDEKSHSLTATACRETRNRECYNMKGYYKNEENTSKYRRYQKITFDIEKSSEYSSGELMYNIHYVLADQGRSLKSKFLINAMDKTIGYNMQFNKQRSENDAGSCDVSVFLPFCTCRASLSFLQNSERQSYEIEIVPDASVPSKKITAGLKNERQSSQESHQTETTGHFKVDHAVLETPIHVNFGVVRSSSKWPISGKFELEYSRNPGDKLTAEMMLQNERNHPRKQAFLYSIYSADRDIDLIVEVLKTSGEPSEPTRQYGWHWVWHPNTAPLAGGLLISLGHDSSLSTPCTTNVTYYGPSSTITLLGRTLWSESLPVETKWKLVANDELLGEAEYHREGSCGELQIIQSRPVWKSRVCFENVEQGGKKRLSIECYHKDVKCVDCQADFNPYQFQMSNLDLHWRQEELRAAARTMKEMSPSLKDEQLESVEAEMMEKVKRVAMSFKRKVYEPVKSHLKSEMSKISESHQEKVRQLKQSAKEFLKSVPSFEEVHEKHIAPLMRSVKKQLREAKEKIEENLPEEVKDFLEEIKKIWEEYEEKYCSRGTFCYEVRLTYRRRGMKQVQKLLQKKFFEIAEKSHSKLKQATRWIPSSVQKVFDYIRSAVDSVKKYLPFDLDFSRVERLFEKVKETTEKIKQKFIKYWEDVRQKIIDIIDESHENEDVQVLFKIYSDAKNELKKQWMQTDFKKMLEPVPSAVLEAVFPRQWINEKLAVQSDIKNGSFQLQMKKPLDQSKITLLRNTFIFLKNKYQQSWN